MTRAERRAVKVKVNVNILPFGHYRTEETKSESTVVMAPTPIIKDYTSISESVTLS